MHDTAKKLPNDDMEFRDLTKKNSSSWGVEAFASSSFRFSLTDRPSVAFRSSESSQRQFQFNLWNFSVRASPRHSSVVTMFVGYPRPKPSTTPTPTARMGQQGPPTRSSMTDEDRETLIQIFSTRNSRRTAETATLESVPSQKNEPSGEEILVSLADEPEDPTTSAFVPATSKDGEKVNSLGDELLEAFSSYSGDPFALTMEGPPGIQTEDLEPAAEDPAKDAGRNDGMWEMWPENPFGQPIPSPSLAAGGDFVDLMLFSEHDVATITENVRIKKKRVTRCFRFLLWICAGILKYIYF